MPRNRSRKQEQKCFPAPAFLPLSSDFLPPAAATSIPIAVALTASTVPSVRITIAIPAIASEDIAKTVCDSVRDHPNDRHARRGS